MTILLAILAALVATAAVGVSAYTIGERRGYRDGWEEGLRRAGEETEGPGRGPTAEAP